MTSPNLNLGSLDDFDTVANAVGIAASQGNSAQDWINQQVDRVTGEVTGIVGWIADGLQHVVGEIIAFATSGDVANLQAAAAYIESKISGFVFEVIEVVKDIFAALTNTYTGDDPTLLSIQAWRNSLFGWVDDVAQFIQNLLDAILRGIRGIPVVGGTIADIIAGVGTVKTEAASAFVTASTAQSAISTGVNGAIVSQGVLDGLTYQLQVFTSNGTFTPPTPATGKEIAYFIGTAYSGGDSGDRVGNAVGSAGQGGRGGRRVSRRIAVADMGSSQPITVGAGGAPATVNGPGNAGGPSWIGPSGTPLVHSGTGAAGVPTPYGDLPSAGDPGAGGAGGQKLTKDGSSTTATYDYTEGKRGEDGGGLGGIGGASGASWLGGGRSPGAGGDGAVVGDHTTGGGGGGGGGAGSASAQAGAAGGAPGGGGGSSGSSNSAVGQPASGGGGRGQVDILTVFKDVA